MKTAAQLNKYLLGLDGQSYKAYKGIKGAYAFPGFTLYIDHVQGDPFAAPSRFRVLLPQEVAGFPSVLRRNKIRRVALADYLIRKFVPAAHKASENRGSGKSGQIGMDPPGQEVLERTAAIIHPEGVELRFKLGLPARGRRILGRQAIEMIHGALPEIIAGLRFENLDAAKLVSFIEVLEDAEAMRAQLSKRKLIAFVANGAILPRISGVDARPMRSGALPFRSPSALEVVLDRPNGGPIAGMGLPPGLTLIVGGGYHGKSTLLRAMACGVYNHIPGDGREFVVCDADAVKIRAEDGRSVRGLDISPFINHLPGGRSTRDFSSKNASGSTSQAANIMEALELGARVLLIDEDTSATNFMIRDRRMQALIAKNQEPITPFIDKVRPLFIEHGVSTILVAGSSGDYFDFADRVIALRDYQPYDLTRKAKEIAQTDAAARVLEEPSKFGGLPRRVPVLEGLDPRRAERAVYVKVHGLNHLVFGRSEIDFSALEQLLSESQLRAIAQALLYAKTRFAGSRHPLPEIARKIMSDISAKGLDVLAPAHEGDLAAFRRFEWAAGLNRLRDLEICAVAPNEACPSSNIGGK